LTQSLTIAEQHISEGVVCKDYFKSLFLSLKPESCMGHGHS